MQRGLQAVVGVDFFGGVIFQGMGSETNKSPSLSV